MNDQTYQELRQWAKGKPAPIACLGPLSAFVAEPLHRLLSSKQGLELLDECALRSPQWDDYYQSDRAMLGDLPADFLQLDEEAKALLVEGNLAGVLGQKEAIVFPFLKPRYQRELLEQAMGMTAENVDEMLAMLSDDRSMRDQAELEQFLGNGAVRYVMRLVVPCFICHRRTPQCLCSSATDAEDPDLDALRALLKLDPGLIRSDAVEPILFGTAPKVAAGRLEMVRSALGAMDDPLELRDVKRRMAGFVSYVSHLLGMPLQGPAVRKLFDIRSRHFDPKCFYDPDLLEAPGTLQKTLIRERERWEEHFKPDNNFVATVRALYAPAA